MTNGHRAAPRTSATAPCGPATSPPASAAPWSRTRCTDDVVWREYLETVARERDGWHDFYRAAGRPDDHVADGDAPPMPDGSPCSASAITVRVRPVRSIAALAELRPDLVLIEGPPEADALIPLVAARGRSAHRWRCWPTPPATCDGPRSGRWPCSRRSGARCATQSTPAYRSGSSTSRSAIAWADANAPATPTPDPDRQRRRTSPPKDTLADAPLNRPGDPLALLAEAAGYDDAERWWDDVIEHRRDGVDPFTAIAEAMAAVRAGERLDPGDRDTIREAYMRGRCVPRSRTAINASRSCAAPGTYRR